MGKRVCVVCKKECSGGTPVQEDPILSTLRSIKEKLNAATGNTLVVCAEDIPKAKEKRARFENRLMWHSLVATAFFLVTILLFRSLQGILFGLAVALFVLALSLASYFPAVSTPASRDGERHKRGVKAKG